jgi:putative chitinase
MIKIGSTGEDVKKVQTKLGLSPDGVFGPGTEKVVKEWQRKQGLAADGIIGQKSWDKLFGENTSVIKEDVVIKPVVSGLNIGRLKGHIPDVVLSQIDETARKFKITTNLRLAHFLSQCSHESGNFTITTENLYYSADGLKKVFGKYFPNNLSESYAKQPEKIASRVYGNRMGNGDELTKDGWKYRGRGFVQMTGKSNYEFFSNFIGEDCVSNPDLVSTKYPLASAAYFFNANGLWSICDKGSDDKTVGLVTKRVNGGTNGLDERLENFKKYYNLLTK